MRTTHKRWTKHSETTECLTLILNIRSENISSLIRLNVIAQPGLDLKKIAHKVHNTLAPFELIGSAVDEIRMMVFFFLYVYLSEIINSFRLR